MARSKTSYGSPEGNEPGAGPGNQLARKHGFYSEVGIAERVPGKVEQLFEQMPWLIEADWEGVKSFAGLCLHEDDFMEATGGKLFTTRGRPKKGFPVWKEIQHSKREWMKILAMGPGPRSQYAQAMSGAGKNMVEVRSGLKSLHQELQTPVPEPQNRSGRPETPPRDS